MLLRRRIGRNEIATIEVLESYSTAQWEYSESRADQRPLAFAAKFVSTPGEKDGLYWQTADGEPESPLGPLVANASFIPGDATTAEPEPYHGYVLRMLECPAKGENVDGKSDGAPARKMMSGCGAVAFPVKYGNSGVMTFIVSHAGIVYEKDLGADTATAVESVTTFQPDDTWAPARP